jgi:hypothetical protein
MMIHGVWNGAAISIVAGGLRIALNAVSHDIDLLGILMVLGGAGLLFVMTVAILVFLPLFNYQLRNGRSAETGNLEHGNADQRNDVIR